jgi:hypothetical protein
MAKMPFPGGKFRLKMPFLPFSAKNSGPGKLCLWKWVLLALSEGFSATGRLIQRIDADQFDKDIGQWVLEQKLIDNPDGDGLKNCGIAIDGKTVRGSHNGAKKAIHLLSAVIHKEGVVFAQEQVDEKTNEIKHVKPLFKNINIEG